MKKIEAKKNQIYVKIVENSLCGFVARILQKDNKDFVGKVIIYEKRTGFRRCSESLHLS